MKNLLKKLSLALVLVCVLTAINIGAAIIKTSEIAALAGAEFENSHPECVSSK